MSGKVWMSSVLSNQKIGYQLGTRGKLYGRDWDPENGPTAPDTDEYIAGLRRSTQGFALKREQMPEAFAVSNERHFKKVGDLFAEGGFFVVRGKLAEVLSRFDLGEGGLIPFPGYQADLETPYPGEFFLLNFGARKNSVLFEQCEDAREFYVDKDTGVQVCDLNYLNADGKIVFSSAALQGADLWFEEAVYNKIFISDALAQALIEIGMEKVFRLFPCTVMEGGQ